MNPIVHVSTCKFYRFKGWIIEYDRNKPFGPWPCNRDFEPRKNAGRKFYRVLAEFLELSIEDQEKHRV